MSTDKKIGDIMTENGDINLDFIDNLEEEFPEPEKQNPPKKTTPAPTSTDVKDTKSMSVNVNANSNTTPPRPQKHQNGNSKDIDSILKDLPPTNKKPVQPTTPHKSSHKTAPTLDQKAVSVTPKVSPLSPLIEAIISPHIIINETHINDIIDRLDPDGNVGIWNRDIIIFILRNAIMEILLLKEKSFKDDVKLRKLCKEGSKTVNNMIEDVAPRDLFYDEKTLFSKYANAITKEVMDNMERSSVNRFSVSDWLNGRYPKDSPRCSVSGEVIKPDEFFYVYHCCEESFLFKTDTEFVLAYAFKHVVLLLVTIKQFVSMYADKFIDKDAKVCIEELKGGGPDDDDYSKGAFFNDLLAPFNDYACILKAYSRK